MKKFYPLLFCLLAVHALNAQNVGIGVPNPDEKLHVDSTVRIGKNQTLGALGRKNLIKFGDDNFVTIGEEMTDDQLYLRFGTLAFMRSANSIGNGYIGIQTETPGAHLDVNGTFRLRGNGAALGKVLTSDANGFATWQTFSGGGWGLTGNAGTNPATNFLGTTDNQPLVFRQNNVYAGKFHYGLRNYFIGNYAGINSTAPFNIAMGDSALNDNVSGYSNVALGSGALQQSPGYSNLVAVGDSALFKNGSFNDFSSANNATKNTAVGSKALYSNTTGYGNTGVGFEAGYANGGGYNNTLVGRWAMRNGGGAGAEGNVAVGVFALDSNNNIHNTAVGAFAMRRNRTGIRNVAVGHSALSNNQSGSNNAALGYYALNGNADGYNNAAVGFSALGLNKSGYGNVAVGNAALAQSDNYAYNVAVGDSALYESGSYNDFSTSANNTRSTAVGAKALFTAKNGYGNTALGYEAGYRMGLAWNNTAIGAYAMRNGGGNGAEGNVAVGRYALDSNNNFHNTSVGDFSMRRNRSGINNTAVGYSALNENISGSFNTAIGYAAGVSNATAISNSTAVGAGAYVTQSNSLVLGASTTNIGIGTSAPSHAMDIQANSVFGGKAQLRLHESGDDYARLKYTNTSAAYWDVAGYPTNTAANAQFNFYFSGLGDVLSLKGNGNATLAGTLTQLSDARLKQNIALIPSSLTRLVQLNGYQYHWKDAAKDASLQLGIMAQEVEKLFPELVKKDEHGVMSVNYNGLIPVLINSVKEQQAVIEKQQRMLEMLERRLTALENK